jgi:hypothetical protein
VWDAGGSGKQLAPDQSDLSTRNRARRKKTLHPQEQNKKQKEDLTIALMFNCSIFSVIKNA